METEAPNNTSAKSLYLDRTTGSLETRLGWGSFIPAVRDCEGSDCHCASACFLIWTGGVERDGTVLGLHRPAIAATSFASLPADRASILYRQLLSDIGKYLAEMEVPRRFIEIMTDTSSKDIRWLTNDEAQSMEAVPSIAEWVASSCGAMSKTEKNTMFKIGAEISSAETRFAARSDAARPAS